VLMATGTIDHTIVDGLIELPDKPAAAAQPGASGQWQMLQPAGLPPAPPEAKINGISASNDLWIGARRLPRSSSLTGSGDLCPADSPAGPAHEGLISSPQGGSVLPSTTRVLGSLMHGATGTEGPCPSHGLAAMAGAQTMSIARVRAGRAVGQAFLSKNPRLPLPPGRRGLAALVSSRQAIPAPGGREPTANENGSQRS
jgi:hypothetical protein